VGRAGLTMEERRRRLLGARQGASCGEAPGSAVWKGGVLVQLALLLSPGGPWFPLVHRAQWYMQGTIHHVQARAESVKSQQ